MERFYFTYGLEDQPFRGGWTEVVAPGREAACAAFRAFHPDRTQGLLNCSSVYDQKSFERTTMFGPSGNFGCRCHEIITITRTI